MISNKERIRQINRDIVDMGYQVKEKEGFCYIRFYDPKVSKWIDLGDQFNTPDLALDWVKVRNRRPGSLTEINSNLANDGFALKLDAEGKIRVVGWDNLQWNAYPEAYETVDLALDFVKKELDRINPTVGGKIQEKETIHHPDHYGGDTPYEVIKILKAKMTKEEFTGFCLGNVIKYVLRHKSKAGMEDLKKAQWYLNHYIEKS